MKKTELQNIKKMINSEVSHMENIIAFSIVVVSYAYWLLPLGMSGWNSHHENHNTSPVDYLWWSCFAEIVNGF